MIRGKVEEIAADWQGKRGALIGLLQEVQSEFNYVPPEALPVVAQKLNLPLSQVFSVATFYTSFSLEPRGEHMVTCCLGTACHVRGGERVANEVAKFLKVGPSETTPDGKFTFETVRCLGTCALAPVMVVDGRYYGKMTVKKVRSILREMGSTEDKS